MKNRIFTILVLVAMSAAACGQGGGPVSLEWNSGDTDFSGIYMKGKTGMPGVVIFHQWMGLSSHEKDIAMELNRLGYSVLAADLYGKGNMPADRAGAAEIAGSFYKNRDKLRNNGAEAVKAFMEKSQISADKVFVIGYCFGGTAALELARTGAPYAGFVSLHGGLANPNPDDDAKIKGRLLVLHGAEDKVVPMSDVTSLIENMRKYNLDFSVHIFSGAVHGFTHKNDSERYNKEADESSWKIMTDFFKAD